MSGPPLLEAGFVARGGRKVLLGERVNEDGVVLVLELEEKVEDIERKSYGCH